MKNFPSTMKHVLWQLLCVVIDLQIKYDLFANRDIKKGELVRYNWKAKVYIKDAILDNINNVMKVVDIDGGNVIFDDEDGCDPFWARRLYWWEK